MPPARCFSTCGSGSSFCACVGLARRWTMISVSVVLWKICPCSSYMPAEQSGVDQIAVMRHRHRAHEILPQQRLGIAKLARAGRRISNMPDGRFPGQLFIQHPGRKDLADQPHSRVPHDVGPVADGNPCRFLPAMLLRKQPLVSNLAKHPRSPRFRRGRISPSFRIRGPTGEVKGTKRCLQLKRQCNGRRGIVQLPGVASYELRVASERQWHLLATRNS